MAYEDLRALNSLSFRTSSGEGFRDLRVTSFKRICPHCGEPKDVALDVCWDPEKRCQKDD